MGKKYVYTVQAGLDEILSTIKTKAHQEKLYVRFHKGELVVQSPKLIFGGIPIRGQTSFVSKVYEHDGKTTIQGRFGVPQIFYKFAIGIFIVFSLIFLLLSYLGGSQIVYLIPNEALLFTFGFLLIKLYIGLANKIFTKQNKIVIAFFEKLEKQENK